MTRRHGSACVVAHRGLAPRIDHAAHRAQGGAWLVACVTAMAAWIAPTWLQAASPPTVEMIGQWGGTPTALVALGEDHLLYAIGPNVLVLDVTTPTAPQLVGRIALPRVVKGLAVSGDVVIVNTGAYVSTGLIFLNVANPSSPQIIASMPDATHVVGVTISGNYAYLARAAYGVDVVDISNPASPVATGVTLSGDARTVAVANDVAYLVSPNELRLYDVSDPLAPRSVSSLSYATKWSEWLPRANIDAATGVGQYAYVRLNPDWLAVVDVADPADPRVVDAKPTAPADGTAKPRFARSGDHLVTWKSSAIDFFDVHDAAHSCRRGTHTMPNDIAGVALSKGFAFIALEDGRVEAIELATATSPVPVSIVSEPKSNRGYIGGTGYFYVIERGTPAGVLKVYDVHDIAQPTLHGSLADAAFASSRPSVRVGSFLYIFDGATVIVFALSDPDAPARVNAATLPWSVSTSDLIAAGSDHIYVLRKSASQLAVLDITDRTSPSFVTSVWIPTPVSALPTIGQGHLYWATSGGLGIADIRSPGAPQVLPEQSLGHSPTSLLADSTRLYLTYTTTTLYILDISNPAAPAQLATYRYSSLQSNFRVRGVVGGYVFTYRTGLSSNYALPILDARDLDHMQEIPIAPAPEPVGPIAGFIVDGGHLDAVWDDGWVLVDVSSPKVIEPTTVFDPSDLTLGLGYVRAVGLSAGALFVGHTPGAHHLTALNVRHPTAPSSIGDLPIRADEIDSLGPTLVAIAGSPDWSIYNVAEPASPSLVGQYDASSTIYDVRVVGDRAFLCIRDAGVDIVDVHDPAHPQRLGNFNDGGTPRATAPAGQFLYIADSVNGLQIADVSDPSAPTHVATAPLWPANANSVLYADGYAYVGGSDALHVFDVHDTTHPVEVGRYDVPVSGDLVREGSFILMVAGTATGDLHVIDMSDPAHPQMARIVSMPGTVFEWARDGHYFYGAAGYAGVIALRVGDFAADFDLDADVDLQDFNVFMACFNGPGRPYTAVDPCDRADTDADGDVDLTDFQVFMTCFNGPNHLPARSCP